MDPEFPTKRKSKLIMISSNRRKSATPHAPTAASAGKHAQELPDRTSFHPGTAYVSAIAQTEIFTTTNQIITTS